MHVGRRLVKTLQLFFILTLTVNRPKRSEQPPSERPQHCAEGGDHHLQLQLGPGAQVTDPPVLQATASTLNFSSLRDKVWAVKWYRGNFEIFRYIADEQPPTKVFKLDNFEVDVSIFYL